MPVRLYEPSQAPAGGVVWLADFDGLTPELLPGWAEPLSRRGVRVVCPTPGPTWWLDRPDPAFHEEKSRTAWRWLREALAPWAAERFEGPLAWAGAGAGGQAAIRAGFKKSGTPAVWAYAPAVALDAVFGRGSTLDRLFDNEEQARVAGVLTDVNPLARPRRLHLAGDPGEVWFPGAELLVEKLRSGGVPVDTDFETRHASREAALNAAGAGAVRLLADALTFAA
ncbi:hypothetical protein [Alienimonas californiensis]|uniref:hypothetical protein n=1 Tax=Alienimonas californiensis TaxID=2527989 RepID=UPI0011A0FF3B|nr:hypothetical protein [Alienimonas californiensis]